MNVSKYSKVDQNILLEYIYDDSNLISEPYNIIVNIKDGVNSFISASSSATNNIESNQLFLIDPVSNNYGIMNTSYYSFLQQQNYSASTPIQYDTIKIHLPINYTFGQYIGCYAKVYTYGYDNKTLFEISNFYFDLTNVSKSYLLNYTAPPLLFQEKLWGKYLQINIPSVNALSSQRTNNVATLNSINSNLTNGMGLSITSPVFIDFHFINTSQTINNVTTYLLAPTVTTTIPQTPDYQQLGLNIQHATDGDYFQIYGTYNGSAAGLDLFIQNALTNGSNYTIQYNITMFEQNIQGQTTTIVVSQNFDQPIEYRPIIKYSTTTAIIDVEMNLIDSVNNSSITREASYGMLQDEVAKYSLNLSKINLKNANKPIIYNTRSSGLLNGGMGNANGSSGSGLSNGSGASNITIQSVNIPYPVLADKAHIIAKSTNVINQDGTVFYGLGQIMINIFPFDNVIQFIIAQNVVKSSLSLNNATSIEYLDMSSMGDIEMEFTNSTNTISIPIYQSIGLTQSNLAIGQAVFLIPQTQITNIRNIYNTGNNVFYITSTSNNTTTVIYTGLYQMYDSITNINDLNSNVPTVTPSANTTPSIIDDPTATLQTAIVTRKLVSDANQAPPIQAKPGSQYYTSGTVSNG